MQLRNCLGRYCNAPKNTCIWPVTAYGRHVPLVWVVVSTGQTGPCERTTGLVLSEIRTHAMARNLQPSSHQLATAKPDAHCTHPARQARTGGQSTVVAALSYELRQEKSHASSKRCLTSESWQNNDAQACITDHSRSRCKQMLWYPSLVQAHVSQHLWSTASVSHATLVGLPLTQTNFSSALSLIS